MTDFGLKSSGRDGREARCKPCRATAATTYRAEHRVTINARDRAHHAADPARRRTQARTRYQHDRNRIADRTNAYRAGRPELAWLAYYRRRCRRYGITAVIEPFTLADFINRWGDACWYCGAADWHHLDHVQPVAAFGRHSVGNTRPACAGCNRRKAAFDRAIIAAYRQAAAA